MLFFQNNGLVGVDDIGMESQSSLDRNALGRRHLCSHCWKCFAYPKDLRRHALSHTGEKPYKCPFCSHGATQKSNLKKHIYNIHGKII